MCEQKIHCMPAIFKNGGHMAAVFLKWRPNKLAYLGFSKKEEGHMWMQTLSAILDANFWDLQCLFHFEKSYCKGVCVCAFSKSATKMVRLQTFQVTFLDEMYNLNFRY